MEIRTASAVYTGGGIYIYYGQLTNGLYFRTWDDWDAIYICDSDTAAEEADYGDFFDNHTVETITGEDFAHFWNAMLTHIIEGGPTHGESDNYATEDLKLRFEK